MTATPTETFTLTIGDLSRELPLVRPTPTTRLPLVEFLGDTQLARAAAAATVALIPEGTEVLFTCETSSIPYVHSLAEMMNLPYEVARKRRRPYMHDPIIQDVQSMTLGVGETLWLDLRHAANLRGKNITIVLDVVASGGTIASLEKMILRAGGKPHGRVAAFSHGQPKIEIAVMQQLPILDSSS